MTAESLFVVSITLPSLSLRLCKSLYKKTVWYQWLNSTETSLLMRTGSSTLGVIPRPQMIRAGDHTKTKVNSVSTCNRRGVFFLSSKTWFSNLAARWEFCGFTIFFGNCLRAWYGLDFSIFFSYLGNSNGQAKFENLCSRNLTEWLRKRSKEM